jgi:hypothetical protein
MIAIFTLLTIVTLSMLMVRVATVMLMLTGLSKPLARFQARSELTGTGFTTSESEQIVNHPLRRRIISNLMLLGNAGIVTTVSALIVGFVATGKEGSAIWERFFILIGGLVIITIVATSGWVDRRLTRLIYVALKKYTRLDVRDYASLLHLTGDYGVHELFIGANDWLSGEPLQKLRLSAEGVLVLGIQRKDGTYLGAPRGAAMAQAGDTLIIYGRLEQLAELDGRRKDVGGQLAHTEAIAEQTVRAKEEKESDALPKSNEATER